MDSNTAKALIKQRGIYKASLTRMQSFLNNFNEGRGTAEITCRLENLNKVYSQYDEVQTKLEIGDESEDHSKDREAFEELYFSVVGGLQSLLAQHRVRTEGSSYSSEHSRHGTNSLPPLPKITLPVFSGDYKEWTSFKDTFQSLVIDNEALSQVQMLHYLNSALKGEAKQLIQGVPISNENFKVAWSLIKTRYDNPRLIAVRHVHELLTPPKIAKNSPTDLRLLLNHMTSNKAALEALKLNSSLFELMLIQITLEHLNRKIREEFEVTVASQETSSWSDLVTFLENRCQALEIVNADNIHDAFGKSKAESSFKNTRSNKSSLAYSTLDQTCVCCKQTHYIYRCERFKSLSVPQRLEIVKGNKLCFNCLSPSQHKASDCKSGSCRSCGGRHHTLLHAVGRKETQARSLCAEPSSSTSPEGGSQLGTGLASYCSTKMHAGSQVLLSTASILVLDSNKRPHKVRCLLDSCSQSNYITEELVQRLGLKKTKNIVPIEGISGMIQQSKHCVTADILSRVSEFKTDIHCSVLTKISNHLPAHKIDVTSWNLPKDISLADPEFFMPGRIDLLLGTEIFFRILKQNRRTRGDDWPVLQDTQLGYILAGRYQIPTRDVVTSRNFFLQHGHPLDVQLRKFWELEEVPVKKQTEQELACEMHFKDNTLRDEEGRFIVRLPRKQIEERLGNSYFNALNRFHHLESRFKKQPILQQQYCEFMKEYEDLRHMKPVDDVPDQHLQETYYIPHHAIFKEHSTTTKLRVVFDCSSKSTTGVSLNDMLMVGPVLQEDLYSIVLRFRTHPIAFAADIEKMYRQVLVHPDDLKLQRILWSPNPNLPLRVYELQTLTYGMVPSSYLATRCLVQLADEGADEYPLASRALRQDFYMDDVLSGGRNLQEALQLQSDLIELLASGGFPLRKFCSNHPADLISRGINAEALKDSILWWQGAPYLKNPSALWPAGNVKWKEDNIPESKVSAVSLCTTISDEILHRFSKLGRLMRVLAYCQRFFHNMRHANRLTGVLSSEELKSSLHLCIRMAQQSSYKQDIEALRNKNNVSNRSTLLNLHPFLDNQGLLRVGGRLSKSPLPFEVKHQIILPPDHHLTRLIIQDEHLRLLHGGSQLLTTMLRERYWIPRIRQTIRSALHKCLTCFKLKKEASEQLMGQLPSPRVQPSRPFFNTGVDYTGPLVMKLGTQRSRSTQKCYVALFICLCTKAVHLELVTDLTSQAFIAAFRRFVARRGKCRHLYSDNGTNFVGASKELQAMRILLQDSDFQREVQEFASTEMFTWHFIPPSAPHFGGLWEANIKSMKHHLRRVVGPVSLTYEELSTLLCQVEACLNSRPLTTLSDNPDDLSPLTPGHFLIGSSLVCLPEVDVTNVPVNKLSRWKRLQQFLQHIWRRWSTDYLNSQQQRLKWKSAQPNIHTGTVVLLKDDRTGPLQWKMGVIQETHPGADGLIRVVTVRTSNGEMRRPVHKLVPLPAN